MKIDCVTCTNKQFPSNHSKSSSEQSRRGSTFEHQMLGRPHCINFGSLYSCFTMKWDWHPSQSLNPGKNLIPPRMSSKTAYLTDSPHEAAVPPLKSPPKYKCSPRLRARVVFPVRVGPQRTKDLPLPRTISLTPQKLIAEM